MKITLALHSWKCYNSVSVKSGGGDREELSETRNSEWNHFTFWLVLDWTLVQWKAKSNSEVTQCPADLTIKSELS